MAWIEPGSVDSSCCSTIFLVLNGFLAGLKGMKTTLDGHGIGLL